MSDQAKTDRIRMSPRNIEQQYGKAVNLDKHQRKSKRKEERLREQREMESLAPRLKNIGGT